MKKMYLQSVRSLLDCPAAERERLMARLGRAVSAYLEDAPEASEADLAENFGSPENCAARLLEECGPGPAAAERRRRGRRARIVLAVLAVVAALAACLVIHMWKNGGLVVIEHSHYEEKFSDDLPKGEVIYDYGY